MVKNSKGFPDFDDIVFEVRNKEYGAYLLRKNYVLNAFISLLIGIFILTTTVITPFVKAKLSGKKYAAGPRTVEIQMENLDQPVTTVVVPPPPPPPPASITQQVKYLPPVVVDSVKPEDAAKLMTADEAKVEVNNDNVAIKEEPKKEINEEEGPRSEPFLTVEEMPVPEGGEEGLLKFIAENTKYPEEARENNVQGTVIVKFCVTSKGSVELVSIIKSVNPDLDREAIRVVKSLPPFKPGKHQGIPVPVWYVAPIKFSLQ